MENEIIKYIEQSIEVKNKLLSNQKIINCIKLASELVFKCLTNGGKLIIAGNGGSAADSQHIAAEFVSRFMFDRDGLPSIALTTDSSVITAIGNDYGFENLFSRQLQALAKPMDIFLAISTSGNSPNILKALEFCKRNNIKSIGLTGNNNGKMNGLVDFLIDVPSTETSFIQESHICIGHIICMISEKKIFNKN